MVSAFARLLEKARGDIHQFSHDIMRFKPTKQQSELFDKVQFETFAPLPELKKVIACKSGQGPGKTAATTVIANFRVMQVRNSMALITAPTQRQVEDIWINEFTRQVERAHPEYQRLLDIQKKRITIAGVKKWGIITATGNKSDNVSGYHENNMTVIVEEACGIPRIIWQTLKGTISGENNLLIAIGNPNDRDTEFFDAFNKDSHLCHTLTWSAEDSPHVDPGHIKRLEAEYGRESDIFRVRVLGEFPRESPNVVIRYEDLLYACRKTTFTTAFGWRTPKEMDKNVRQIGIDLARFGSDESVICVRFNSAEVGKKWFSKCEPADVIAYAFDWQNRLGWTDDSTVYCVDAGGMGQGVMHLFRDKGKRYFEFHSQGSSFETTMYKDAITEAYFYLRHLTRQNRIHLKEDPQTFSQLVNRQYRYDDGLFRLESKDEFLTRVEGEEYSSPDRADATALAFYPYANLGMISLPI